MAGFPKTICFDLDDTLIAYEGVSEEAWRASFRAFAGARGDAPAGDFLRLRAEYWSDRALVEADIRKGVNTREAVLRRLAIAHDIPFSAVGLLREAYSRHRMRLIRLFPDVPGALSALAARGCRLIYITNGKSSVQREKIARFGLDGYFDEILIEEELGSASRHARLFAGALPRGLRAA